MIRSAIYRLRLIGILLLGVMASNASYGAFPGARIAYHTRSCDNTTSLTSGLNATCDPTANANSTRAIGICDPNADPLLDGNIDNDTAHPSPLSHNASPQTKVWKSCIGQNVALQQNCNPNISVLADQPYLTHLVNEPGYNSLGQIVNMHGPHYQAKIVSSVADMPRQAGVTRPSGSTAVPIYTTNPPGINSTVYLAKDTTGNYVVRIFNAQGAMVVDATTSSNNLDNYILNGSSPTQAITALNNLKQNIDDWYTNHPANSTPTSTAANDATTLNSAYNNSLIVTGYTPTGDIYRASNGQPVPTPLKDRSCQALGITAPSQPFRVGVEFNPSFPPTQNDIMASPWPRLNTSTLYISTLPLAYQAVTVSGGGGNPLYDQSGSKIAIYSSDYSSDTINTSTSNISYSNGPGGALLTSMGGPVYASREIVKFTGVRNATHATSEPGCDSSGVWQNSLAAGSYVYKIADPAAHTCVLAGVPNPADTVHLVAEPGCDANGIWRQSVPANSPVYTTISPGLCRTAGVIQTETYNDYYYICKNDSGVTLDQTNSCNLINSKLNNGINIINTSQCTRKAYQIGMDYINSTTCQPFYKMSNQVYSEAKAVGSGAAGTLFSTVFSNMLPERLNQINHLPDTIVDIPVGQSSQISPSAGITFSVNLEGSKACVYAYNTLNPSQVWKVGSKYPLSVDEVNSVTRVKQVDCIGNNVCINHVCVYQPQTGSTATSDSGTGFYCTPGQVFSVTDNAEDHCVAAPSNPVQHNTITWSNLISNVCMDYSSSQAHTRFPIIGVAVQCVEDSLVKIFIGNPGGIPSFFSVVQNMFKNIVRALMAMYIIFIGYRIMMGKQKILGKKETMWVIMKLSLVTYFALGNGIPYMFPRLLGASKYISIMFMNAGLGVVRDSTTLQLRAEANTAYTQLNNARQALNTAQTAIASIQDNISNANNNIASTNQAIQALAIQIAAAQSRINADNALLNAPLTSNQTNYLNAIYSALSCNQSGGAISQCLANAGCTGSISLPIAYYKDIRAACTNLLSGEIAPSLNKQLDRANSYINQLSTSYQTAQVSYNNKVNSAVNVAKTPQMSSTVNGVTTATYPMSYTVPLLCNKVTVQLWGGGGSGQWCRGCENDYSGASGGYISAEVAVSAGQQFTGQVGRGGGGYADSNYTQASVGTSATTSTYIPDGLVGDGGTTTLSFGGVPILYATGGKVANPSNASTGRTFTPPAGGGGALKTGIPPTLATTITNVVAVSGSPGVYDNYSQSDGASAYSTPSNSTTPSLKSTVGQSFNSCQNTGTSVGAYAGRATGIGAGGCATDDGRAKSGWGGGGDGGIQVNCTSINNAPTYNDLIGQANAGNTSARDILSAAENAYNYKLLAWLAGATKCPNPSVDPNCPAGASLSIPSYTHYAPGSSMDGVTAVPIDGSILFTQSPIYVIQNELNQANAQYNSDQALLASLNETNASLSADLRNYQSIITNAATLLSNAQASYTQANTDYNNAQTAYNAIQAEYNRALEDAHPIQTRRNTGYDYCDYRLDNYTPGYESMQLWDTLDCRISHYLGIGLNASDPYSPQVLWVGFTSIFSGAYGIFIFVLAIGFLAFIITLTIRMAHIYIMAVISLVLLCYISPIVIPMVFFGQLSYIYNKWFSLIISYVLQPVILFAFLSFIFIIVDTVFYGGNTTFGSNGNIVAADGSALTDGSQCQDVNALGCIFQTANITSDSWYFIKYYTINYTGNQEIAVVIGLIKLLIVSYLVTELLAMIEELSFRLTGGMAKSAAGMSGAPVVSTSSVAKVMTNAAKASTALGVATAKGAFRSTKAGLGMSAKGASAGAKAARSGLKGAANAAGKAGDKLSEAKDKLGDKWNKYKNK